MCPKSKIADESDPMSEATDESQAEAVSAAKNESMRWYVDDVLFQQVEKPTGEDPAYWPFDNGHSFFIILNLAVGGRFDNPHRPPENLTPQRLYVDFVRVYQTAEGQ